MGHRYRPVRLQNGAVIQSGLNAGDRYRTGGSILDPSRRPFRALVVNSRVVGEDGQVRHLCVECDVLLVRTNIMIQNVPVAQKQHGINNVHDLWVPRPTTRALNGAQLNLDRQFSRRGLPAAAPPTPLDECDGDMVLLDFIEGDLNWPVITHALTHERTNRVLRPGTGTGWREGSVAERGEPRRDEYYTHHYGCEIRINERGELLIDTVGAYEDPATEDASPTTIGQVRVRVKEGQRFTVAMGDDEDVLEVFKDGSQVRIDLGESAGERLVLGDSFRTFLNNFFSLAFDVHTHSSPAGGSTGTPSTAPATQMGTDLLSDLASTKKT